jgi:phage terminase large subunit-like protein
MHHDPESALLAIDFIQSLKLTTDPFYGKQFDLLKWQHDIMWDVYGTKDDRGRRQYKYVYLEVPKKNGKTELIAGAGLFHTFFDGVMHGEVYGCAAEKEQAAKAFNAACIMIEQNTYLKKRSKIIDSKKTIIDLKTGTFYKVLSAEAYSKHGLNVSACLFDELHAQPNRNLWDVMTSYAGDAREEPIWWIITTAGDDPDHKSIGWEIHEYARKVRDGEIVDPTWYVKIYGAPEDADIWDERTWYACNPSLGYTIDIEKVRQAALTARNSASSEKTFRWLRLNQWVSLKSTSWLPLSLWDTTTGELTKADLVGKRCYAGIDLSTINDLTGLALLFPPQDGIEIDRPTGLYDANGDALMEKRQGWYYVLEAWHPLENMKERVIKDKVPYDRWAAEGWLNATPGNVIDYTFIEARIAAVNQQYEVIAWGNDPRGAEKLRQDLQNDHDIELLEVAQDIAHLSEPMKEIERLSKNGEMAHERNPLGRWTWGNVTVHVDGNGNYKPMKNKPVDKIDPMAALFNAMYLAMKIEPAESAYETRGIRVV